MVTIDWHRVACIVYFVMYILWWKFLNHWVTLIRWNFWWCMESRGLGLEISLVYITDNVFLSSISSVIMSCCVQWIIVYWVQCIVYSELLCIVLCVHSQQLCIGSVVLSSVLTDLFITTWTSTRCRQEQMMDIIQTSNSSMQIAVRFSTIFLYVLEVRI